MPCVEVPSRVDSRIGVPSQREWPFAGRSRAASMLLPALFAATLLLVAPPAFATGKTTKSTTKPATKSAAAKSTPKAAAEAATEAPAASPAAAPDAPAGVVAAEPKGHFRDGVVAVVDGDPITLAELKRYGVTGAPFLPPEVRGDYQALLASMIEHKLLKAEFEKNGIVATDEMVDRYIANVLQESHQTRQALEADIARVGLTWKDYHERMREEVQRIQLVNLLIRSRVNVPEEEVRRVWEEDPDFVESEKIEVGAIFLPSSLLGTEGEEGRRKAEEVRKEADRNFEAAAKKYSKGPGAAEGGHLGEFKRGTMAPQFEAGLKGLGVGDVSQPVEGSGGYWIVKLIAIRKSERKPFDEVKEELTDKLYDKRLAERYQKWANEDLRKEHRVEILLDKLAIQAADS